MTDTLTEAPIGIYRSTPAGSFTYANPAMAALFGCRDETEFLARYVDIARDVYADPHVRAQFQDQLARDGYVRDFETRFRRKDGTIFWALESARAICAADGGVISYEGFIQAIDRQKHAEKAAEHGRRELEAVFQAATSVSLVKTDLDLIIEEISPGTERIYGYTRAELLGSHASILRPPGEAYRFAAYVNDILWHGHPVYMETELKRRDGTTRPGLAWMNPVYDESGQIVAIIGIALDISQRKRMEHELRAAKEQADFANRTKAEFLAKVSHELRTPLNAIMGFSEVIRDELFGQITEPRYVSYAKDIHDSAQHLLAMINEILDMARIEAGRRTLFEASVDVAWVVASSVRLLAARAHAAGVSLTTDVAPDLPRVWAEERALKQIVTNLVANAVKFTDPTGHVAVAAYRDAGGGLVLAVSDDGVGMDAYEKEKALTPFGQGDSVRNRMHGGTGLGLSVAKSLAELHDAKLELTTAPGAGTTVRITLPSWRMMAAAGA